MRWLTYLALIALCVVLGLSAWRVSKALEAAVVEAKETMHQARLALGSIRGLTFDVRRNWTANTDLQQRVTERALTALERTTRATERTMASAADASAKLAEDSSLLLATVRERLVPAAEDALCRTSDAAAAVPPVLEETRQTIAAVRPVLETTQAQVEQIGMETSNAIAGVRPIFDQGAAVGKNFASTSARVDNVAGHYEQMILHPSKAQRIKGWLSLFFSGLTAWGNAKLLF